MLRRLAVFCILQLLLCTAVVAQNPGDFMNMFSTLVRAAIIDHARREWSKFPLQEGSCIEQALQQQEYSIDLLVQNGIVPTDPRVSSIRSGCRLQPHLCPAPQATSRTSSASRPSRRSTALKHGQPLGA